MDQWYAALENWGCDMTGAMDRFVDDETLYEECLPMVVNDENFGELGRALAAGDARRAFECAHAIKGVVGNMGLTPLYETAQALVEPLRAGESAGLEELYRKLLDQREYLKGLVE